MSDKMFRVGKILEGECGDRFTTIEKRYEAYVSSGVKYPAGWTIVASTWNDKRGKLARRIVALLNYGYET